MYTTTIPVHLPPSCNGSDGEVLVLNLSVDAKTTVQGLKHKISHLYGLEHPATAATFEPETWRIIVAGMSPRSVYHCLLELVLLNDDISVDRYRAL